MLLSLAAALMEGRMHELATCTPIEDSYPHQKVVYYHIPYPRPWGGGGGGGGAWDEATTVVTIFSSSFDGREDA